MIAYKYSEERLVALLFFLSLTHISYSYIFYGNIKGCVIVMECWKWTLRMCVCVHIFDSRDYLSRFDVCAWFCTSNLCLICGNHHHFVCVCETQTVLHTHTHTRSIDVYLFPVHIYNINWCVSAHVLFVCVCVTPPIKPRQYL
jgi:hypothetical protein